VVIKFKSIISERSVQCSASVVCVCVRELLWYGTMLTGHRDDVDVFIPKTVLQFRDVKKSSWSQMIASRLETCRRLSPFECQVQFLGKIQCWN